jgi:hypothetical protein
MKSEKLRSFAEAKQINNRKAKQQLFIFHLSLFTLNKLWAHSSGG